MLHWRLLPARKDALHSSMLLVKANFERSSYIVHVTDLKSMWTEDLGRKAIIRRALDEDTSIDPSDGAEQLKTFLGYVKKIIDGEEGTSLFVNRGSAEDTMTLTLTAELPAPLKLFSWTMSLLSTSISAFADEMVIPNLRELYQMQLVTPSLLDIITEKDHVISKLRDKLEMSGVDMTSIFPGSAIRGSKSLEHAVPGIERFDPIQWRQALPDMASDLPKDEICRKVFSDFRKVDHIKVGPSASDRSAYTTVVFDSQPRYSIATKNKDAAFEVCLENVTSNTAELNKQDLNTVHHGVAVPKQAMTPQKHRAVALATDSDNGSDTVDENEVPVAAPASPTITQGKRPTKKRIGTIGKRFDPPTNVSHEDSLSTTGASEGTEPRSVPVPAPMTPQKKKGKIGRIGGNKAASLTPEKHASSPLKDDLLSRAAARPEQSRGRQASPTPTEEGPRENSRERADRIRAELKREMEEKKKAPPKKKRKF